MRHVGASSKKNGTPEGGWLAFVVSHPSSKKTLDGWGTQAASPQEVAIRSAA
jgi:hypothetical protein